MGFITFKLGGSPLVGWGFFSLLKKSSANVWCCLPEKSLKCSFLEGQLQSALYGHEDY